MNTDTVEQSTTTPDPALAGSLSEYRASREKPSEPAAEEKKVTEPAAGAPALEDSTADSGTADLEQDDSEKPARKGGFQRTIEKQKRQIEDLTARLAGKPAATTPPAAPAAPAKESAPAAEPAQPAGPQFDKPKPKLEDHESIEAFTEALTDWKLDKKDFETQVATAQRAAQAEGQKLSQTWNSRVAETKERHPDYDAKMAEVADIRLSRELQRVFLESEVGPQLAYELASDPKELKRIAALTPLSAARELGRIEARLLSDSADDDTAPNTETKVSAAPKPIRPVGAARGTAAGTFDVSKNSSLADYRRAREAGRV